MPGENAVNLQGMDGRPLGPSPPLNYALGPSPPLNHPIPKELAQVPLCFWLSSRGVWGAVGNVAEELE